MATAQLLTRAYHVLMAGFVTDGRALHYTELGSALNISPAEALTVQTGLTTSGIPIFTQARTDYLAALTPLSSIPTHCRIAVDGVARWYAICAVEALAVSWLFPGQTVTITSPCLDCNGPVQIVMRDGLLLDVTPDTAVVHTNIPAARWSEDWAYGCNLINYFRSAEHVHAWDRFDPTSDEGIMDVAAWVRILDGAYCRDRLDVDYFDRAKGLRQQLIEGLAREGKHGAFWGTPERW
jgi:hypothetical protein